MAKKIILIVFYIILAVGCAYPASSLPQSPDMGAFEQIKETDRILVLAPHPDDEAIGCAGVIQDAVNKGAKLKVAYLTNGDHNQVSFIVYEKRLTLRTGEFIHMGEVRKEEATKAMKLLGVDSKDLIFLGYPDFGTFTIFKEVWQEEKPYKSMLTRISKVPYKENLSFGAPYKGESILTDIKKVLMEFRPNKIFVSHPADANVDHKAFYLFLQIALRDLDKEIPRSSIYPYLIHCIGWPMPRHYHPQMSLNPPRQFLGSRAEWVNFELAPEQVNKKYQAILCYRSQTSSSAFYLLSFARKNELFGDYPEIRLKKQAQEKGRPPLFFGISNMFNVSRDAWNALEDNWNAAGDIGKGKGQVSYGLQENNLLIRLVKSKRLSKKFSIQLYLFGYSSKTPFASMPKIRIITKHKQFKIFDGKKIVKPKGLSLELNSKELLLKVPLELLGEPDFILAAVKTYSGMLHTDTTSFRKISIK